MGTAQQRLFLVLKVVLHAVVVISEVLRLSTKSRCSRYCRYISTSISDKLMDLRLDFGVYPKSRDGRPPQSLQAMRRCKVLYFKEEPDLDKPVLTSDCGSDVLVGAERDRLWDWNRCACHCLNIVVQAALKEEVVHECLEPLTALAARFSKS